MEQDLQELSEQVFRAVGPARIAAVTLLAAHAMRDAAQESAVPNESLSLSVKRLYVARQFLIDDMSRALTDHKVELPPDLTTLTTDTIAALNIYEPISRSGTTAPTKVRSWLAGQGDLTDHCFGTLEPVLTKFLGEVTAYLDGQFRKHRDREREEAKAAVKEVQRIGVSIRMVAINASVEASRAGPAGAGFSVIAAETQDLAAKITHVLGSIAHSLTRT